MLEIPQKEWEIKKMLYMATGTDSRHPGLLNALKSAEHRRSTKNAYILLVGLTGSGKSTTVNSLFENQEIAPSGDSASCTSEIIEYHVPVPIPELGIKNSQLRVIDTPGLADTRGLVQDSRSLASLKEYLGSHEDLKNCIPNAVFVVAKFDDNRIEGEGSSFVKMLKGLDMLLEKVSDRSFSNLVLILTHMMNAKGPLRTNPEQKLQIFETLVKEFTRFPTPTLICLAENEAEDKNLPMENGYYKLPNGDFFPHNIFQQLSRITQACNDPIGEAIFRQAFKEPKNLNVIQPPKKMRLVESDCPSAQKALELLNEAAFSIDQTEVSDRLEESWWKDVPAKTREAYPVSLKLLQRAFQLRCIRTSDQLPQTAKEILAFLTEVPRNQATMILLSRGLSITVPVLPISSVGRCYHLSKDEVYSNTIFQEGEPVSSDIGFKIPSHIKCEAKKEASQLCKVFNSKNDLIRERLNDLNTQGSINTDNFSNNTRAGYNLIQDDDSISLTCLQEQRNFLLTLKDQVPLTPEFISVLQSLPDYNSQNYDSVETWKRFFQQYGTHVVKSAFGGGAITVTMKGEEAKKLLLKGHEQEKNKFLAELMEFATNVEMRKDAGGQINAQKLSYELNFLGGDMTFHRTDLASMIPDEAANIRKEWVASLFANPAMLQSSMHLVPISNFAANDVPNAKDKIEYAMRQLLQSTLQYVEPPPPPPPTPRPYIPPPSEPDNSCLRAGTQILMADWTSKSVEDIQPGDLILDKNFKSCRVLARNNFFLGQRKFYGFSPGKTFFTGEHMFVGLEDSIYVPNVAHLLAENPLMKYLNVQEMKDNFTILTLDGPQSVQLFPDEDDVINDEKTPVYFLEVADSPSGTYIANGYVCRHELPPFEHWPNTIYCLIHIISQSIEIISNKTIEPLSLQFLGKLQGVAKLVALKIEDGFLAGDFNCTADENNLSTNYPSVNFEDYGQYLESILRSNTLAAIGMLLYAKCGNILATNLDQGKAHEYEISKIVSLVVGIIGESQISI